MSALKQLSFIHFYVVFTYSLLKEPLLCAGLFNASAYVIILAPCSEIGSVPIATFSAFSFLISTYTKKSAPMFQDFLFLFIVHASIFVIMQLEQISKVYCKIIRCYKQRTVITFDRLRRDVHTSLHVEYQTCTSPITQTGHGRTST